MKKGNLKLTAASAVVPVVIVSFPKGLGGPQKWLEEILPELMRRPGLSVETWYPRGPFTGLSGKVRLYRLVKRRLEGQAQKVVYLSLDLDFAAQLLFCLRLIGFKRIIIHAHAGRFTARYRFLLCLYRFLARRAAAWIAVSEQAGEAMFGRSFRSRGKIIPASIDFVRLLGCSNTADSEERVVMPRPEHGRLFAFIGRLSLEKCAHTAIERFARHCDDFSDDRLIIVGDGPERARLEQLATCLLPAGAFRFTGAIENIGWLMRNEVDCVLVPSLFEGQCRVVAEAQFFGATVIASDSVPDIAFLDPTTAIRIPVSEPERWRQAMAGVQVNSFNADMSRARQMENNAPIGMSRVIERFECVVRRVGGPAVAQTSARH
tara:strand:- start:7472 stop:8599 length:1128 start_codon:yes stop_codon:yes gene_type:complete